MDLHILYADRILWPVLLVDLDRLHLIKSIPPFQYATKDGVLSIKVRGLVKGDEELAAVGVGTLVGHAQNTALIVLELRLDFIFKWLTIDAGTVLCRSGRRRAGLDHERRNETVEGRVIIGVGCAEGEEVVRRLGTGAAEELELEVAMGCVQRDGHVGW